MRYLKMLATILVVVVFGVVGAGFYSANAQPVTLELFFVPAFDVSVGLLVLGTLLAGFLIGVALSAIPLFTANLSRVKAKRSLERAQSELQELRMSPIKGADT